MPVKSAAPVVTVEHCKVKREENEIFDLKHNDGYEQDGIEHVKALRVFSKANGAKAAQSCLQVDRAMNPLVKGEHIHSPLNTRQINYANIKEIEEDVKSVVDNFVAENSCCEANTWDCCIRSSEMVVLISPTIKMEPRAIICQETKVLDVTECDDATDINALRKYSKSF